MNAPTISVGISRAYMRPICILLVSIVFVTARADDHRLSLFIEGGTPISQRPVNILINTGYAVGYSEDLKVPLWAAYRLGNREKDPKPDTWLDRWNRPYRFKPDTRTDSKVTHDDYVK